MHPTKPSLRSTHGERAFSPAEVAASGAQPLPWSWIASLGLHAVALGSVALLALNGPGRPTRQLAVVGLEPVDVASVERFVPEREPSPELVTDEPPEPRAIEPAVEAVPTEASDEDSSLAPIPDASREIARLLAVPWSQAAAPSAAGNAATEAPPAKPEPVVATPAPVVTPPRLLSDGHVDYPKLARRLGEEGTVELRIHVAIDGSVASVDVVVSSGSARLDDAAAQGVRSWRFEPAKVDGVPIATARLHRVTFQLEAAR